MKIVVENELVDIWLDYEESKLKNEVIEKDIKNLDDEFKWFKDDILWL